MESLRSRPSQAPRQAERTPSKLSKSPANERGKKTVDDKIKRRMSARYADISSPITIVPPLPTLPRAPQERLREADEELRDRNTTMLNASFAADDKKLLSEEDFDPAVCSLPPPPASLSHPLQTSSSNSQTRQKQSFALYSHLCATRLTTLHQSFNGVFSKSVSLCISQGSLISSPQLCRVRPHL